MQPKCWFMDKKIAKFLEDIRDNITEIEEETAARGKRFEIFCNDRVFRKFIERNIGIIGEAVNQILKLKNDIEITSARRIVNTRNLVIHSYDNVDNELLWAIVINHLPILKAEVQQLIESARK